MVNQREFMSALLHRSASPTVWLNPLRWYPMAHAASGAVTVGEHDHIWDLVRLAWALRGDITTTTVPIGEFTGSDSGSVVVWNSEVADQLFAALKSDAPVRRMCSTHSHTLVRIADRAGATSSTWRTSSQRNEFGGKGSAAPKAAGGSL